MRALLDVNVLLALLDADHADHRRARGWLEADIAQGWASCPITQNGFVRIISQPRYPSPISPAAAIDRLARATHSEHHELWPCDVSVLDPRHVHGGLLYGARQITDVYLLALAVEHRGRFVTFDRSVPLDAVPLATAENLMVF